MATTVNQAFNEFKSNLEITDRQVNLVSTRRTNVINAIRTKLSLHPSESLLIGSYDRKTLIRYLYENDVDLLVILHYGYNKEWYCSDGTIDVLVKFKEILDSSFQNTNNRRDRNCISMKFSEFTLDVVPAYQNPDNSYSIPDTIRKVWIKTNPIEFAASQTKINFNMGSTYVPLIKMVKAWNRNAGYPIRSFHLECIMNSHYSNYTEGYTYNSMLKYFFESLPGHLQYSCYEPITNDRVDSYLDNYAATSARQTAINKAKNAAAISSNASEYENSNPAYAIGQWKSLLGEFFPTYG